VSKPADKKALVAQQITINKQYDDNNTVSDYASDYGLTSIRSRIVLDDLYVGGK